MPDTLHNAIENTITKTLEGTATEALADPRVLAILSGDMALEDLREFFRNFIVTHLNSVQILSFLFAVAPRDPSDMVKGNLMEEMGLEEGEKSHPEMLIDLARGVGFSEADVIRLNAEADEARREFGSERVPYESLRELGLSMLLETVAFELFLSRASDRIAESMTRHYGLSTETVQWFTLHGEVDVRHAEEGKRTLQGYISYYGFRPDAVEGILSKTFVRNVVLKRYFPLGSMQTQRSGPSRIASLEVFPLHIPFNRAFVHSKTSRSTSDSVVVRLTGSDGLRGYGEGLPRAYVTGEDVAGVVETLGGRIGPEVMKLEYGSGMGAVEQIGSFVEEWTERLSKGTDVVAWNATMCALELPLLDWAFRRSGESIASWLGPVRGHVMYTGLIDATDPQIARATAERYIQAGFTKLKVKVGVEGDVERVKAVRDVAGEDVEIRVDANGAWSGQEAVSALNQLRTFYITAVEQPVAASDLEGMRRVRQETGLNVIADESLVTFEDAVNLIRERACDVFNVRVSKCGGLISSLRIAELGLEAGVKVQVGAQVGETSLLSAAGRHLAAHLPEVEYVEGSFGTHLLSEDITRDPVMFGYEGRGSLVMGTGLGVEVDDDTLERLADDIVKVKGGG